ncbi:Flp pilus assembly protein CpaB [Albirhodobacter sp. R86504]|uniref:Flp pilus assembly protein CpaB n=1 Tax=Albirhodobacter sp. R86504 TaxID=3093848 RepID=UPI00366C0C4B
MRMIVALVLALGVGLAGFAVFMAQDYMAEMSVQRDQLLAAQANTPQLMDVAVAKRALAYGERFTMEDVEIIKVQAGKAPAGAYAAITGPQGDPNAPRAVFFDGETRPRAALRSYEPLEPLLETKITEPGVDAGIMANLADNMRAFTIDVTATTGVSGFLRPGDHVDVYWSGRSGNSQVTKLIQPNVRLIAINQNADADRSEETMIARTVTVEVSPEQVAALTLANATGQLNLALVGTINSNAVAEIEINTDQLLGIKQKQVVAVEAERVCTIKTRKGADVIETPIPCATE